MLRIEHRTYFYGEYGCLNYCILGHIEESQPYLTMSTQPDYFKLMKMVCPKLIPFGKEEYRSDCKNHTAFGLGIKNKFMDHLLKNKFVSLHEFFKFKDERARLYIKPLKKPLSYDSGLGDQEYISISFRNIQHESNRNLDNNSWKSVLETIKQHSNLTIIAHGMDSDTKDIDGVKRVHSIEESIAYMNKSKVFIASMSGIAQFASNCQCGVIQIGDPSKHIEYDPFNKGAVAVELPDFKSALLDFLK